MNIYWKNVVGFIGKRLGIDSGYFVPNTLWAIGRNIVWTLPGLIIGPLLARYFTQEQVGQYDLILTIVSFFALASIPGLRPLVTQSAARGRDGGLTQALRAGLFGMIISFPILFAVALYYLVKGSEVIGYGILFYGFFAIFFTPLHFYDAFLQGKRRFDLIMRYETFSAGISGIFIALSIWLTKSVIIILSIRGLLDLLFSFSFYQRTQRLVKNTLRDAGQIRYGAFLSFNSLIPLTAARIDKILLASFFSPAELGLYFFSTIIPATLQRYVQSFVDVTFPKISPLSPTEHRRVIRIHLFKIVLLSFAGSAFLVLTLPFVIPLLFSARYNDAIIYAQLESLSFALFPINLFLVNFLTAQRRKTSQLVESIFPATLKILLAIILIPMFGIFAVIGVNFVSRVAALVIVLYALLMRKD